MRKEYEFRLLLLKADKNATPPLFGLDDFILAFFTTTDQETLRMDWNLARDLMLIRIIESLYSSGQTELIQSVVIEDNAAVEAE